MSAVRLFGRAGAGVLAGLVAGIAMILAMLILRSLFGISPPPEAIPDRLAPTLTIAEFFELIGRFGGYNELKQIGVSGVTGGQLAAGLLIGLGYGVFSWQRSETATPTSLRTRVAPHLPLAAVIGLLWAITLGVLWPNLGASFIGLPPRLAAPVTAFGLLAAYAVFGVVLVLAYRQLVTAGPAGSTASSGVSVGRRTLLVTGFGAALALASGALGKRLWDIASFAYDGTRFWGPLTPITPNDQFYVVTKNVVDPGVERSIWGLQVGGLVERPHTYSYGEIAALPSVSQETTLMCISNGVGDALMSNAKWTGVPLATLLVAVGVRPGGVEALLRGADGYTDTIPLAKALDPGTLVVFEMNGEPLPRIHGYPVRLIVPGMYGEKNVKWVTGIEVVDHDVQGFYEQQGWGPDFVIPIRTRIYEPDLSQPIHSGQLVTLRGIAFGGDKGSHARR